METVVFMLNNIGGKIILTNEMKTVPVHGDFISLNNLGYNVSGRMFNVDLSCWVIIVTKN